MSRRAKGKETINGAKVKAAAGAGMKPQSRVFPGVPVPSPDELYGQFKLTPEKYREKYAIPLGAVGGKAAPHVEGYFATLELQENGSIKVRRNLVKNTEGLKRFLKSPAKRWSSVLESNPLGRVMVQEAAKKAKKSVREVSGGSFDLGFDGAFPNNSTAPWPPNNEYIPLMGGPFNRQLYLNDYLAMWAKCFESKNHNPLAKEIVDIITFFSMGKGVTVKFANPQLQEAWDLYEKRNNFQAFIRMDSDTLTWGGEIMTHKTAFPDGYPRLRHIDPSTVWEVVTDPTDIEVVHYYHQQFPTQYQFIYKADDVAQAYVINDIPADEVIHLKINTTPGEKRGRSDLFNILTWLKVFKDYYYAKVTKAQMEESFALKVTIKGSDADVAAYLADPQNNAVPRPGDKLVQNEAVDHEYMTPTTSSAGSATDSVGEAIRGICATGAGLSPEYLGVGGKSGTRANSITKSEPAARKFEDRQTLMKGYIGRDIIEGHFLLKAPDLPQFQVRESSLGKLKEFIRKRQFLKASIEAVALITLGKVKEPIDKSYQVIFPEIGTEDRSAKLKDVAQSEALGYISHERAATMSATELGVTDYNFDEEQEKIREWMEERAQDPLFAGRVNPALDLLGKGSLAQAGPDDGDGGGADGSNASDKNFKDDALKQ